MFRSTQLTVGDALLMVEDDKESDVDRCGRATIGERRLR